MLSQQVSLTDVPAAPPVWQMDRAARGVLNQLRLLALHCRVAARADLFKACALLAGERDVARDAHARALIRCLDQATGQRPVFHRPGADALTFDEAWLMQAITTCQNADWDSFAFLIRSRIPTLHHRSIAFLIKGTAANLE